MKNIYGLKIGFTALILTISAVAYSANINVSGTIASNTTWNYDTVKVTGDITIANGITLTISAGTYVEFQGHYKLDVKGCLLAQGTASNKITITALTQTVGWKGIRFEYTPSTNATSIFKYCTISYGKATVGTSNDKSGGAIFMYNFSKLELINCIFSNNTAAYYGGAIALEYNASPKILNCLIVNNSASSIGGAIDIYGSSNPTIINTTIANNTASTAGGIYAGSMSAPIVNCIFYGNTATNYSQIYGYPQNVLNCNIQGGYSYGSNNIDTVPNFVAPTTGAGVGYDGLAADYSLASNSGLIDKGTNAAMQYNVPYFDLNGKFRFDNEKPDIGAYEYISSTEVCGNISANTTWSGNILVNCDINVLSGKTLTIQPGTKIIMTGHYRIRNYGRILAQGTSTQPIDIYAWNHSEGWKGFYFSNVVTANDTSKFEYCNIEYANNTSSGGAFYINQSHKTIIRNCIIANNKAGYGGAFYLNYTKAKLIGNLIVNNTANNTRGGGIYLYGTSSYNPTIINNTISNNMSSSYGAGFYKGGSTIPIMKNNIIWGNKDIYGNHALMDNIYPTTGISMTYSDIEGAYTGTGNISSNPLYKNPSPIAGVGANIGNYNYSLQSSSACIDAGTSTTTGLGLPVLDIAGKPRVYNSHVDMGAYEDKTFITVCGTITSDQLWDASIVKVNCDITIPNGVTVTIVPGTKVLFMGHYSIYVKGALQADGAVGDTIIFTAANTTTGWDGIQIDYPSYSSNDSSLFSYCRFEYAKRVPTGYYLTGGALSLYRSKEIRVTHCHFLYNEVSGSYPSYPYGSAMSLYSVYNSVYDYTTSTYTYITSSMKFNNNVFNNNTGKYGTVSIRSSNCEFKGNSIYNNSNTTYGSLYIYYSGGDYMSNLISNNTSNTYGGGVYIYRDMTGTVIRLYNNVIVNNTSSRGGGMYIGESKPEVYNNTIANNYATYSSSTYSGGGILFTGNADANFKSNIIYGNKMAGLVSNQICIADISADPKFYNCNIEGGETGFTGVGNGINYSGVYFENTTSNPSFTSASSGVGAAYSGRSADWSIGQGSHVINSGYSNSSNLGLPSQDMAGEPRFYNGRIDMGAYENQDPIIAACSINSNTVWEADTVWVGCDITVAPNATLSIRPGTHVIFTGYYRIKVDGNILALGSAEKNIEFAVIDTMGLANPDSIGGAWNGIEFYSVALSVDSSKFSYCKFYYAKASDVTSYQQAYGGAMNIYNSPKVAIENCLFSNNVSERYGSALFIESSNIVFRNNIVCNNSAIGQYGRASIYMDDVTTDFFNNTIVNNEAKYYGGLMAYSSILTIKNCLFWGNLSTDYSSNYNSQIYFYNSSSSEMYNNDVQYGMSYVGYSSYLSANQDNIDVDPQFINPTVGAGINYIGVNANWALNANTPLVDRGFYNSSKTPLDYGGNPRVVGDTIDIGAFEVQLSPKFITQNPISQSVCEGTSSSFSVALSINADYQWVHNGIFISGANSAVYIDSSASIADTGCYYCIMSTSDGSVNSDTAIFDIQFAPIITNSPTSTSACIGDSAVFGIAATGSEPMLYAWENSLGQLSTPMAYGVTTIGTQTSSNSPNGYPSTFANWYWGSKYQFIILASELTSAGMSAGNINSIAFNVLNVNSCPALSNYSVSVGTTTASSVSAYFTAGLTSVFSVASYQPINGWNTITFQNAYNWDGTSNIVVQICSNNSSYVSNGNASIALTSTTYNSSVERHADMANVCSQTTGTVYSKRPVVRLKHGSVSSFHYYYIDSVIPSNASVYKCNVSNMCGSALSTGAQLTVNTSPSVVPIIAAASICENSSYTYSTSATGTAPISYQWYRGGSTISGSTSISHSISSASANDDGIYYCKATNTCGDDSTNQSVMTVKLIPSITSQPTASQTLCENQSTNLSVTAIGNYPITYQWYKTGAPIGGAASSTYYISPISISDAGVYKCVATNSCGNDQSNNVTIAVNSPPSITYQSGDSSRCEGGQMSFDLTAIGTAPLTYSWYKGSSLISGANSNSYSLTNLTVNNSGLYHCNITNSCATTTSLNKNLTVFPNPQVSLGNDTTFCQGGSTTIGPGYGYFCLWNNGSYNNQLTVTSTGSYFVNVTDQNGCTAISNTINITVKEPYASQNICMVTVDSATGKNVIVWEKTPNQSIASFNIYKESSVAGVYNIIANQPYDSLSLVFDYASNSSVNAERYVVTVVDSCANESQISTAHRTMHLTVNKGQNNDWNLIWNAYEGFTPSTYKIYRADSTMNYVNIANVSGSSSYTYLYTDQSAPVNTVLYYYVEVVHPSGGCLASKGNTNYHTSRTNHANNGLANSSLLVPAFFGTPTSGTFPLNVHFYDQSQGNPVVWEWDFGDGTSDTVKNPVHSYNQIGVYSVSLLVKDVNGMNSIIFHNYITVLTTGIVEVDENFDVKVFPNPYTDKTNIAYALTKKSKVHIEIFNAIGVKVADLVNGDQFAGSYKLQFSAADYGFSSGVYYLRMNVDGQLYTKKMVEVK